MIYLTKAEIDSMLARVEGQLMRGRWGRNPIFWPFQAPCLDQRLVAASRLRRARIRVVRRLVADYLRDTTAMSGVWWKQFSDRKVIWAWNDYRCADAAEAVRLIKAVRARLAAWEGSDPVFHLVRPMAIR